MLSVVESVSRLMQDSDFDLSNPDRVANVLQGALAATPQVRLLVFCDPDLQFVSAVRDTDADTITILARPAPEVIKEAGKGGQSLVVATVVFLRLL